MRPDAPATHHAARLLACPDYARYDFGPRHPLDPRRYEVSLDLLREAALLSDEEMICPPAATDDELKLVHTEQYIEALSRLSVWAPLTDAEARRYGLGHGDNPVFAGAHAAAALVVGGSVYAARALFTPSDVRPVLHYFHPMGGLHHAMAARASGFCLYNDPAVAIAAVVQERQARVLYVDLDVHHGDGVQRAFEDDPRVMTVSFHESGEHLFPGTGDVLELGRGAGRGTAVNVPLAPGTADDSYVAALDAVLPPLAERFHPDLIVSQQGCDTHAWDPLANLQLTARALEHASRLLHRLAHRLCGGRWLAWGGGGYDLYRVVPRHWALLWAEMSGRSVPDRVPESWRSRWQAEARRSLPETFRDSSVEAAPVAAAQAAERNRRTVERVRRLLLPAPQRLAFPLPLLRPETASAAVPGIVRLLGSMPETRTATIDTRRGAVLLRDWCPPSYVARLHADVGLAAFTRDPARELRLLEDVALHPDSCLTLAHTPEGTIIGQVTICAPERRWAALDGVLELAFEVARSWRHGGLGTHLLGFGTGAEWIEHVILVAEGYAWHWDMEDTGLDAFGYRDLLARFLGRAGFVREVTGEPDIAASTANVFLARIGREVPPERVAAFRARLLRAN